MTLLVIRPDLQLAPAGTVAGRIFRKADQVRAIGDSLVDQLFELAKIAGEIGARAMLNAADPERSRHHLSPTNCPAPNLSPKYRLSPQIRGFQGQDPKALAIGAGAIPPRQAVSTVSELVLLGLTFAVFAVQQTTLGSTSGLTIRCRPASPGCSSKPRKIRPVSDPHRLEYVASRWSASISFSLRKKNFPRVSAPFGFSAGALQSCLKDRRLSDKEGQFFREEETNFR